MRLRFELNHYDLAIQHISHNAMRTSLRKKMNIERKILCIYIVPPINKYISNKLNFDRYQTYQDFIIFDKHCSIKMDIIRYYLSVNLQLEK